MKQTKILQKCIDALTVEKPDISYIKGMLETLVEMSQDEDAPVYPIPYQSNNFGQPLNTNVDEEEIPEIARPGKLGRLN